ncbi:NAD(P)H-hydrate epimerase-like [Littorina saxatilis]|uniref:NAD(P)H-hydrate epimerase-like n=1 Tax=Littorina saxatilis TaxID=31220 RepID=UPI0038B67095
MIVLISTLCGLATTYNACIDIHVVRPVLQYYPPETLPKDHAAVLVCCGPGNNGGDGLVCARHLKLFGYKPSVFYPKINNRPLFQNLRLQCEQMDMPFLSFFPSEAHLIADSYNVVVDAIFGHNYVGPATSEFSIIIDKLKQIHTDVPICSIDIPSGWDVDEGPREELGLQPDMLISLTAPKRCASTFRGKHHVLGGRFVLEEKFHLNLPPYPHTDPIVELKTQTLHAQHSPLPPSSSSSSTAAE